MLSPLEDLNYVMARFGRGLDDSSAEFLARLRDHGVIADRDWPRILEWLTEAMTFLTGPDRTVAPQEDGTLLIDPDVDPRNADWLRIVSASRRAGYHLPLWAGMWLWRLYNKRGLHIWRRIGDVAGGMGMEAHPEPSHEANDRRERVVRRSPSPKPRLAKPQESTMTWDVLLVPNEEGVLMTDGPGLPVELGRGVRLERLPSDLAETIMDACEPPGRSFPATRQYGQRYTFVRQGPPPDPPFEWDSDGRLQDCVVLSRLVRPTSIGFRYSARLKYTPEAEVQWVMPGPVGGFGAESWIVPTSHGDYLDRVDIAALIGLWRDASLSSLPDRLQRALWYHEYAARTRLAPIRWVLITTGIEALINTGKDRVSRQFTIRFPALAQRFAGSTVSVTKAGRAYGLRSEISHGMRLHDLRGEHLELYRLLEDVLRATLREGMTNREVQQLFSSAQAVDGEWPIPERT